MPATHQSVVNAGGGLAGSLGKQELRAPGSLKPRARVRVGLSAREVSTIVPLERSSQVVTLAYLYQVGGSTRGLCLVSPSSELSWARTPRVGYSLDSPLGRLRLSSPLSSRPDPLHHCRSLRAEAWTATW